MPEQLTKRFEYRRCDITTLAVDAIVNAANPHLWGGAGVDAAIHTAAGPELYQACKKIGWCDYGSAVITPGFKLPAKFVIHTVGPIYVDGHHGEALLLHHAYQNSLRRAEENNLKSIAFPTISSGFYGYPNRAAALVALAAVKEYFEQNPQSVVTHVIFTIYGEEDWEIYEREFSKYFDQRIL